MFTVSTVADIDLPGFLSGFGVKEQDMDYYQTSSVTGLLDVSQFKKVLQRLGFAGEFKASA